MADGILPWRDEIAGREQDWNNFMVRCLNF